MKLGDTRLGDTSLGDTRGARRTVSFAAVRRWRMVAAGALVLLAAGCQTVQTTRAGQIGIDRKQTVSSMFSSQQVESEARTQYAATLQQASKKGVLNRDPAETERVRRIAQRLIPQTAVFRDDAPKWQWEVNVIESDEVNAWCMPGGKIAVYSGLIDKLKITDDELAAVMGHEIAHALREHARERMARAAPVAIGAQVLGVVYGQAAGDLGNLFGQAMFTLPNSRESETEADAIGIELAARAGYDPRAAVSLWKKMGALGGGGKQSEMLSTHPSSETRIANLSRLTDKVLPLYEKAKR